MKITATVAVVQILFQMTSAWLFEIEHKGVVPYENQQYSRDIDSLSENQLTDTNEDTDSYQTNPNIPNLVLLRILRSGQDYDGTVRDLHNRAASVIRRFSSLRRTPSS